WFDETNEIWLPGFCNTIGYATHPSIAPPPDEHTGTIEPGTLVSRTTSTDEYRFGRMGAVLKVWNFPWPAIMSICRSRGLPLIPFPPPAGTGIARQLGSGSLGMP